MLIMKSCMRLEQTLFRNKHIVQLLYLTNLLKRWPWNLERSKTFKNRVRSELKLLTESNWMLYLLGLFTGRSGVTQHNFHCHGRKLIRCWAPSCWNSFTHTLPFFSRTLKAEWSSSVPGQIQRQRKTEAENTERHSSVLWGALCLGRSFWGRSGFIWRSLAQQVRGGLECRCSVPSTKVLQKKYETTLHNMPDWK